MLPHPFDRETQSAPTIFARSLAAAPLPRTPTKPKASLDSTVTLRTLQVFTPELRILPHLRVEHQIGEESLYISPLWSFHQ